MFELKKAFERFILSFMNLKIAIKVFYMTRISAKFIFFSYQLICFFKAKVYHSNMI